VTAHVDSSQPTFPPDADFSDLDALAAVLAALAPEAEPIRPLTVLGRGYYSLAVETASGFVFRLGCTEQVVERHEKEARLLPWLQGHLPVAIPRPRWRIAPCTALPYGAIAYPKLAGRIITSEVRREVDSDQLARDLGRFMHALHAVPLDEAFQHGASPLSEWRPALEQLRATVLAILVPRLPAPCLACVVAWWDEFLNAPTMSDFEPVLIQSDLGGQNLLVDDSGRLLGVLDWEHAAGGDPALDFRQLRALGPGVQETALDVYQSLGGRLDSGVPYRLQRHWQQTFWSIQMAARRNDETLVQHHIERMKMRLACC